MQLTLAFGCDRVELHPPTCRRDTPFRRDPAMMTEFQQRRVDGALVDRELAQKIELHIWSNGPTPQPHTLAHYLKLLKDSEDESIFAETARLFVESSGVEFVSTDAELRSAHPAFEHSEGAIGRTARTQTDFEQDSEILLAAEFQEARETDTIRSSVERMKS